MIVSTLRIYFAEFPYLRHTQQTPHPHTSTPNTRHTPITASTDHAHTHLWTHWLEHTLTLTSHSPLQSEDLTAISPRMERTSRLVDAGGSLHRDAHSSF